MTGLSLTAAAPTGFDALLAAVPLNGVVASSNAQDAAPLADGFADLLSLLGVEPVTFFEEVDLEGTVDEVDDDGAISASPDQIAAALIRSMLTPIATPRPVNIELKETPVLAGSPPANDLLGGVREEEEEEEEEEDSCCEPPEFEAKAMTPSSTVADAVPTPVWTASSLPELPQQAPALETADAPPMSRVISYAPPRGTAPEPAIAGARLPKRPEAEEITPLAFELRLQPVEVSTSAEGELPHEPQDPARSELKLPKLDTAEVPEANRPSNPMSRGLPREADRPGTETVTEMLPAETQRSQDIPESKALPKLDRPAPRFSLTDRKPPAEAPELKVSTPPAVGVPQLTIRPQNPSAPALQAPATPEVVQISAPQPPSEAPMIPAREIAVRVSAPDATPVDVHVAQRGAEVRVAVRSADPQMQVALRKDLPALVDKLEQTGFRAEQLTSIESPRLRTEPAVPDISFHAGIHRSPEASAEQHDGGQPDTPGDHQSGNHSQGRQQQQQRRQKSPEQWWQEAMEDFA